MATIERWKNYQGKWVHIVNIIDDKRIITYINGKHRFTELG